MKYKTAVLGGTFDRLHKGHKDFLQFALSQSERLIIGLTSDSYVQKNKQSISILSFDQRKKELDFFLKNENKHSYVEIVPIDINEIPDKFQSVVSAIIATDETLSGADALNKVREERGLKPLPVLTYPLVYSKDSKRLSSTRVRMGEIDRQGEPFLSEKMLSTTYVLPNHVREKLKKPIGKIVSVDEVKNYTTSIISVGDVTTKTLVDHAIKPIISVIDFIIEREKTYNDVRELGFDGNEYCYFVKNEQSTISSSVFKLIAHLFYSNNNRSRSLVIVVSGEEDLIVLPVILLAPLGVHVLYGQPGEGMVDVLVTEKIKEEMKKILSQFESITE